MRWFTFTLLILLLSTCNNNPREDISNKDKQAIADLSSKRKLDLYEKSFEYFKTEMKGSEMHYMWLTLFENYTYVIDGNARDKAVDCLGAYFVFFEKIGANLIVETIPNMVNRNRKMFELRQIKIYKDEKKIYYDGYNSIRQGDVIIFHYPNAEIKYHIVVIWGKSDNMLQYCEMGGQVKKVNFTLVNFNDPSILMIFSHSWASWIGDSFNIDKVIK